MFTPLRGLRIGRRAVVIGFVLAGATATAVGAASGNPIWHGALRPFPADAAERPTADASPSTDAPLVTDGPPATEAAQSPVTEPATSAPAITEPVTTVPVTAAPDAPVAEPTPVPAVAPVVVDEPAPTEPATTEPTAPAPSEPAPAPAPAPKASDNVVPATLSLSCTLTGDGATGPVSCSWSGGAPGGFASYVLLRGDPDGKGRVPFRSADPGASTFLDTTASAGNHSYVVVALDPADHPLAHSNMVLVQIATT